MYALTLIVKIIRLNFYMAILLLFNGLATLINQIGPNHLTLLRCVCERFYSEYQTACKLNQHFSILVLLNHHPVQSGVFPPLTDPGPRHYFK